MRIILDMSVPDAGELRRYRIVADPIRAAPLTFGSYCLEEHGKTDATGAERWLTVDWKDLPLGVLHQLCVAQAERGEEWEAVQRETAAAAAATIADLRHALVGATPEAHRREREQLRDELAAAEATVLVVAPVRRRGRRLAVPSPSSPHPEAALNAAHRHLAERACVRASSPSQWRTAKRTSSRR